MRILAIATYVAAMMSFGGTAHAKPIENSALNPQLAADLQILVDRANATFARLPTVALVEDMSTTCGADQNSDPLARYCIRDRRIYIGARGRGDMMRYQLAHIYGHAVQVRHGVADVALRTIRKNRKDEGKLRGMVTRQVDCIAGGLYRRAYGNDGASLRNWFRAEPFTGSHWGGGAISQGPKVTIGLNTRDQWFRKGRDQNDFSACTTQVFGAELLLRAERR